MFTFNHINKLIKHILYTADIQADKVVVTWYEKGKTHKANYSFAEADAAILSGDWIIKRGL
jgi:hypothetical protein